MVRGAWRATVHRVAKSRTQLKRFSTHFISALKNGAGNTLAAQWLKLCLQMQGVWIQSLIGELRSHMHQSKKAHGHNY